mmetsp:Transcript_7923/g.23876  ORF Transcript_7923/g.23876 Transcript_7923/m.23876 type:complete len:267 (+) Transcript_7923:1442-2242(+)
MRLWLLTDTEMCRWGRKHSHDLNGRWTAMSRLMAGLCNGFKREASRSLSGVHTVLVVVVAAVQAWANRREHLEQVDEKEDDKGTKDGPGEAKHCGAPLFKLAVAVDGVVCMHDIVGEDQRRREPQHAPKAHEDRFDNVTEAAQIAGAAQEDEDRRFDADRDGGNHECKVAQVLALPSACKHAAITNAKSQNFLSSSGARASMLVAESCPSAGAPAVAVISVLTLSSWHSPPNHGPQRMLCQSVVRNARLWQQESLGFARPSVTECD